MKRRAVPVLVLLVVLGMFPTVPALAVEPTAACQAHGVTSDLQESRDGAGVCVKGASKIHVSGDFCIDPPQIGEVLTIEFTGRSGDMSSWELTQTPCGSAPTRASYQYMRNSPGSPVGGPDDRTNTIGWSVLSEDALAVTVMCSRGGLLSSADMRIDSTDPWFISTSTTGCSGRYDLYTIVLHEAGHAFGLGHASKNGQQVMKPGFGVCEFIRYKRSGDLAGMSSVY